MRARWMIIPLVLLLPAVAFAQTARGNDREAVVQAERQWADATVRCDTIALARMFSDSLEYVHTNGVADNKAAYMKKLSACAVERVEIDPSAIQILGDVAVVRGVVRLTFKGREPGNRIAYLRAYARHRPGWQLVASQGTDIATGPPVTKPATGTQGLLGTWRLLEYWDRDSIGAPKRDVYGTQPCGYLIYTPTGHVSVQIASGPVPGRLPADSTRDGLPSQPSEAFTMLQHHVSYFGTFTVDSSLGVVVHHVEADAVRRITDTHNPRPFHLEGDSLTLGNRTTWSRTLVREKPGDPPNPACRQPTGRSTGR